MSFPEPGRDDLKAIDGSSCPTYSSPGLSSESRQRDDALWQIGSLYEPECMSAFCGMNAAGIPALA